MRKPNTKTTVPLNVAPERRTKRFPPRLWPAGRFFELRFRYLSSPAGREGEISRPLDHMRQIPFIHSARLIDSTNFYIYIYYMPSSASGQYAANSVFRLATRAGKMERNCPPGTARFVPANKISPKFKRVHESYLSLKLLSAKVKRFFLISLSFWNQQKRPRE